MTKEVRTDVTIANQALDLVAAKIIAGLDDENASARVVARFYFSTRNLILERYDWSFASKRKELAASATAPVFGFDFAYTLPVDLLALREVAEDEIDFRDREFLPGDDWRIEGTTIVTPFASPIFIRYTREVESPALFSSLFAALFAHELAIVIGPKLSEATAMTKEARKDLARFRDDAQRLDAQQRSPQTLPDGTWIRSRRTSSGIPGL
ncbi:MAG: hypothetical protein V3W41_22430 [Planctomycetota bacterium]